MVFIANGIQATIPVGFAPLNNNSTWISIPNVVVGGDDILNMEFGCTVAWVRSGYNLIELTKIS